MFYTRRILVVDFVSCPYEFCYTIKLCDWFFALYSKWNHCGDPPVLKSSLVYRVKLSHWPHHEEYCISQIDGRSSQPNNKSSNNDTVIKNHREEPDLPNKQVTKNRTNCNLIQMCVRLCRYAANMQHFRINMKLFSKPWMSQMCLMKTVYYVVALFVSKDGCLQVCVGGKHKYSWLRRTSGCDNCIACIVVIFVWVNCWK